MKLRKTRDGDDKVRDIVGGIRAEWWNQWQREGRVRAGVHIVFTDDRGATWWIQMTDAEAKALAAQLLEVSGP